jgi:hypothetical protein
MHRYSPAESRIIATIQSLPISLEITWGLSAKISRVILNPPRTPETEENAAAAGEVSSSRFIRNKLPIFFNRNGCSAEVVTLCHVLAEKSAG